MHLMSAFRQLVTEMLSDLTFFLVSKWPFQCLRFQKRKVVVILHDVILRGKVFYGRRRRRSACCVDLSHVDVPGWCLKLGKRRQSHVKYRLESLIAIN